MYRIMLGSVRASLATDLALGREQDAATALAVAIDQDALAYRLLDCADIHFQLARCALTPTGALRESARALQLMEKAGEAKRFSNFMLGCAVTFEKMDWLGKQEDPATEGDYMVTDDLSREARSTLMAEGIFDMEMYGELPDDLFGADAMVRDEVEDGRRERREFARNRDYNA
jgi:hypothetical protein